MQSEFDKAFKSINNKKRLTIVMGILALILLIAALFFVIKEKDNKKKNPNNQKPIIDQSSSEENPVYSSEEISNLLNINQSNNVCVDLEKIYSEIIRLAKLKKYPNIANFNTYDLDYSTIGLDKNTEFPSLKVGIYPDLKVYHFSEIVICDNHNNLIHREKYNDQKFVQLDIYEGRDEEDESIINVHNSLFTFGNKLFDIKTRTIHKIDYEIEGESIYSLEYYRTPTSFSSNYVSVVNIEKFENDEYPKMNIIDLQRGDYKKVFPIDYDDVVIDVWDVNLIRVRNGDKFGLLDTKGNVVVPVEYDWIGLSYGENKDVNYIFNYYIAIKNNQIDVLDKNGKSILKEKIVSKRELDYYNHLRIFV